MLTKLRFEDLKNNENVKTAVEHISLYVGLVVFTALGAKVGESRNLFSRFRKVCIFGTKCISIFAPKIKIRIFEIDVKIFVAKIQILKKLRKYQFHENKKKSPKNAIFLPYKCYNL